MQTNRSRAFTTSSNCLKSPNRKDSHGKTNDSDVEEGQQHESPDSSGGWVFKGDFVLAVNDSQTAWMPSHQTLQLIEHDEPSALVTTIKLTTMSSQANNLLVVDGETLTDGKSRFWNALVLGGNFTGT